MHFRITTRGDDTAENCHPFVLNDGALIHNGTLDNLGSKKGEGKSDTRELSELLYDIDLPTLRKMQPLIEVYLDYNKVAVMHGSGEVLVFNEKDWINHEGVLFSNDGYLPYWESTYNRPSSYRVGGLLGRSMVDLPGFADDGIPGFDDDGSVESEELRLQALEERYPNLWHDTNGWPHYECAHCFRDTWADAGFGWDMDNLDLYRTIDGVVVNDKVLENAVLKFWNEVLSYTWIPDPDDAEDVELLNNITYDLLQESEKCTSTPTASAPPPTATTSESSRPTSVATFPSPSSSTAKSPASTAASSAPPIRATA